MLWKENEAPAGHGASKEVETDARRKPGIASMHRPAHSSARIEQ